MAGGIFDPEFDQLPMRIPIFPLPSALLLPGGQLPLNIFEPRYLAMVRHALATPTRLIGMVQPLDHHAGGDIANDNIANDDGQNQFSDQEFLNQSPDLLGRQSGNCAFSGREDTDS
jgi:hypothetical protein